MSEEQSSVKQRNQELLQWHPAFFAGLQIEFQEEARFLIFEQEHLLGTKPMSIDVLIKKEEGRKLRKNIGRIFRKYNIIEYKSPEDYLSIDDFYKVYGYACFYKSDTAVVNERKIEELTISLISDSYPRGLIQHLEAQKVFGIQEEEKGIYLVIGTQIPIQIIVTRELPAKENLWLRNLTNHLGGRAEAEALLADYGKHKKNKLYKTVMNFIVRANKETFQEVKNMCEALEELMKDELEAKKSEGERIGKEIGKEQGTRRANALVLKLSEAGRTEDILKAAADEAYQKQLFLEFGL